MLSANRIALIVTTGEPERFGELAQRAARAAESGADVRIFFRDESIPLLCKPDVAARLLPGGAEAGAALAPAREALAKLAGHDTVRLYACSSSLYLWGVGSGDLIDAVTGARGLIAFLAEDLAGAREVLTY